jgi:hypothetical protein
MKRSVMNGILVNIATCKIDLFSDSPCNRQQNFFTFCDHCNKCHTCNEEIKLVVDMKDMANNLRDIIYQFANETLRSVYHYH